MKVDIERVIEIIREELCVDDDVEINGDTKLRQELEMDSLDTISLISALEDEYDINEELNYTDLITVNDIVDVIKQYV
ncbi:MULTISPECIES: acyl carrier protein [Ruminococcus]|uniref:Acyl carrier protein n=1 Tax=Ruminococcus flavefaciens TaxID=1265 RepID=A0A315YKX0_RUMFL|nr:MULTISPECIES: phosphopantetheine-binding protein [Ruminococcus]MBR1432001.1 acyl carrier protein [Ruminococcus sp.]PWJ12168.1 acyl carrier protein [Ruminococcus flavefaciens]SSA49657.1 acyl carrier protein [Ruminococcus flavefaciens]